MFSILVHVVTILYTSLSTACPTHGVRTGLFRSTHQLSWDLAIVYKPISHMAKLTNVAAAAGKKRRGNLRRADLLMEIKAASWLPALYSLMGLSAQT